MTLSLKRFISLEFRGLETKRFTQKQYGTDF